MSAKDEIRTTLEEESRMSNIGVKEDIRSCLEQLLETLSSRASSGSRFKATDMEFNVVFEGDKKPTVYLRIEGIIKKREVEEELKGES